MKTKQETLEKTLLRVIEAGVPGAQQVSRTTLETVIAIPAERAGDLEILASYAATWASFRLGLYEKALADAETLAASWYRTVGADPGNRNRPIYAAILSEAYLLNGRLLEATSFARLAVELLPGPDEDLRYVRTDAYDATALRVHSLLAACQSLWDLPAAGSALTIATGHMEKAAESAAASTAPWTLKLAEVLLRESQGSCTDPSFVSFSNLRSGDGPGECPFEWVIHEFDRALQCIEERQLGSASAIIEAVWRQPNPAPIPPLLEDLLVNLQALSYVHRERFFTTVQLLNGRKSRPGHVTCIEVPRSMALLALGHARSLVWSTQECVDPGSDHHLGSLVFILMQRALAHEALGNPDVADREFSRGCHLLVEASVPQRTAKPTHSAFRGLVERLRQAEPEFYPRLLGVMEEAKGNRYAGLLTPVTPPTELPKLSYSEFNVAQWLATDLTMGEIAKKLHLSINTVKTHSRAIYSKVEARSRAEAVEKLERIDFPLKGSG